MYFDTGVNLTHGEFKRDIPKIVKKAQRNDVEKMIIIGLEPKQSRRAHHLAIKFDVYSTAGIHPHNAKRFNKPKDIENLKETLKNPKVVAVGECGLDYFRMNSPQNVQKEVFEKQVELAYQIGKPLFLHERNAAHDFLEILDNAQKKHGHYPKAVVHCFTSNIFFLQGYLKRGFYISFAGLICHQNRGKYLREKILPCVPMNRIMAETDAPFMYPVEGEKKTCFPQHIKEVVKTMAESMGVEETEMTKRLYENSQKFFFDE